MITYAQLEAMDKAFHDACGAAQGILCVAHSIHCATPAESDRLRQATSEMVQRFAAAKAAYVAAKEGAHGITVFADPNTPPGEVRVYDAGGRLAYVAQAGYDANGAEAEEVAQ